MMGFIILAMTREIEKLPVFFLSYGRRDDNDGDAYVTQFHKELAERVAQKLGISADIKPGEIGFFDQQIEPGEYWPEEISKALRTCRAFVCLLSPSFLRSKYCGKELQIFKERIANSTPNAPLVFPIFWDSPSLLLKMLPQNLLEIQSTHASLGKDYAKEGLRYLMQRSARKDFLNKFAERLAEAVKDFPLSESTAIRPLNKVTSYFDIAQPVLSDRPQRGPNAIKFAFIAGHVNEAKSIGRSAEYYGPEGGRDWRPYYPKTKDPIGVLAQKAAAEEGLFFEDLPVSEEFIQNIRMSEHANTIVLLLVDLWTISIQRFRRSMEEFDKQTFLNCGLLIPQSDSDTETSGNSEILRTNARLALTRTFILNHIPFVKDCVRSHKELSQEISAAVAAIRRHMIQSAEVFKKLDSANGNSASRAVPIISGVSGDNT